MIKTLAGQVKEFKKDSIITPIFMILEVIMEMIIPLLTRNDSQEIYDAYPMTLKYWYMDGCGSRHRFVCRYYGRKVRCKGINRFCP